MGDSRRRKLAGDPPKGLKRVNPSKAAGKRFMEEMLGGDPMVTAMALMMVARRHGRTRMSK